MKEIEVTDIWRNILQYNKIVYIPKGNPKFLNLINLTTNDIIASANKPSELLDKYFAEQIMNMNRE
jgi:hypothetical protein